MSDTEYDPGRTIEDVEILIADGYRVELSTSQGGETCYGLAILENMHGGTIDEVYRTGATIGEVVQKLRASIVAVNHGDDGT